MPRYLVVMGVAGCGKSTVAAMLAARLGWPFAEGDALHPALNIEKMRLGIPLDDTDREPWLRRVAAEIAAWRRIGTSGVITCSALRRRYRDLIRDGHDDVWFVYLHGSRNIIAARLGERRGHFMPASLLESQFATLEEPAVPEQAITVDVTLPLTQIVETVADALAALPTG